MTNLIYIRPLILEDAQTSYSWRNDKKVWIFTNFRVQNCVTLKMEIEWLQSIIDSADQCRFAICLKDNDLYIGNVQILDIKNGSAELHLFIGNRAYWGKGIGYEATNLILEYAFDSKKLDSLYLKVHPANISAIVIYEKAGFEITGKEEGLVKMGIKRDNFFKCQTQNPN